MTTDGGSEPDPGGEVTLGAIPLHSTNLLTVLDPEGHIRYESPSIERIYGFEQQELIGESVAEYFHPEDRSAVVAAFEAVVAATEFVTESIEYRHRCADGSYMWVESVASSDPTPEGYYVVNTRDVSERRARERRLEATNERLEAFASVVSHDLRNPLSVARARVRLAHEERESEHLAIALDALDRSDALVDDLLALARAGEDVGSVEPLRIDRLAETSWEHVETATATLDVDIAATVAADRTRFQQLFENLFRNGVEHGGADATITVGRLENGFYVEDDGSGLNGTDAETVFEPTATDHDRPGIGLSIVDQVARAHGWDVRLEESGSGGARFEITGLDLE